MLRTDRRTEGEEKAAKVNANKGCLQLLTQRVKQTMRRRRRRSIPQNRHCHICSPKSTMMRNGSQARVSSTLRPSRAVPHPSTNRALRRLTSEVGRDPVHSTRYGRQRKDKRTRWNEDHAAFSFKRGARGRGRWEGAAGGAERDTPSLWWINVHVFWGGSFPSRVWPVSDTARMN